MDESPSAVVVSGWYLIEHFVLRNKFKLEPIHDGVYNKNLLTMSTLASCIWVAVCSAAIVSIFCAMFLCLSRRILQSKWIYALTSDFFVVVLVHWLICAICVICELGRVDCGGGYLKWSVYVLPLTGLWGNLAPSTSACSWSLLSEPI